MPVMRPTDTRRDSRQPRPGLLALAAVVCLAPVAFAAPKVVSDAPPTPAPGPSEQRASSTPASTRELVLRNWPGVRFDDRIPTPEDVLGVSPGQRFLRHDEIIRYAERVAEASDRVTLTPYGRTPQDRPLVILTVTSPENHADLDAILEANRALAQPANADADATIANNPAIAWLSFGVHGNEPGPTGASVPLLYALAAARGPAVDELLSEVVTVIDPCLNPDGRQRYLSWYENTVGVEPDAHPSASERFEPWPGGRTNHYHFDLNRDWVWGAQDESRQRLPIYRRYMPQLHIDSHEQGYENPFFFGEGDTPYHANIPQSTKDWIKVYGKANAAMFDARGWVYSTAERFDYLYPGYGKVLPVYHGAVGLLTEAAGHSRGGLAVDVFDHYRWTALDRIERHFAISLDYLMTTAENREGQLRRFRGFFTDTIDRARREPFRLVVAPDNDPRLLARVWELCALHGIRIDRATRGVPSRGLRDYRDAETATDAEAPAGSWVISAEQPMGLLVRTLFARDAALEDADTYDITAWSVPPVFGLKAWYADGRFDTPTEPIEAWAPPAGEITGDGSSALVVDTGHDGGPAVIAAAVRRGLHVRLASESIEVDGLRASPGSVIVPLGRNTREAVEAFARDAEALGARGRYTATTITSSGPVLGANAHPVLRPRPTAIVRGRPVYANSFGEHRWLLDRLIRMPHTQLNAGDLDANTLDDFGALVLPASGRLSEGDREAIDAFVRSGGVLVASGASARWVGRDLLDLGDEDADDEDEGEEGDDADDRPELSELSFAERRARNVEDRVPGALLHVEVDTTHPLNAGLPSWFGVVARSALPLEVADDGFVLARYAEAPRIAGSISDRNADRLAGEPFATLHRHGRGWVVSIAEDVTLRGFMVAPRRIILNAVTMAPAF